MKHAILFCLCLCSAARADLLAKTETAQATSHMQFELFMDGALFDTLDFSFSGPWTQSSTLDTDTNTLTFLPFNQGLWDILPPRIYNVDGNDIIVAVQPSGIGLIQSDPVIRQLQNVTATTATIDGFDFSGERSAWEVLMARTIGATIQIQFPGEPIGSTEILTPTDNPVVDISPIDLVRDESGSIVDWTGYYRELTVGLPGSSPDLEVGGHTWRLDYLGNSTLTVVPEPSAFVLLSLGVVLAVVAQLFRYFNHLAFSRDDSHPVRGL
jgi:hypothetical protein